MSGGRTYVVELTPAGRGAVSVVLVRGPGALEAASRCFTPTSGRPLSDMPLRQIALGRWGGPQGEELIVCRPALDCVEVHCHGGVAAVRGIVKQLVEQGCRHLPWQEWLTARSPDPICGAAAAALASAVTARTAAILLDQQLGALSAAVQEIVNAAGEQRWAAAAEGVKRLLACHDVGRHLTQPWLVVLAGRPNVGKSSLLNALAGFPRAIVAHTPGTTRDVVKLSTAIDGWPVQLADTAGLHQAGDELESAGIGLADEAMARADLLLFVSDGAAELQTRLGEIGTVASFPRRPARVLEVLNKIDILSPDKRSVADSLGAIQTSALTGEGIPQLIAAIGAALVPDPPAAGTAVPFAPSTSRRWAAPALRSSDTRRWLSGRRCNPCCHRARQLCMPSGGHRSRAACESRLPARSRESSGERAGTSFCWQLSPLPRVLCHKAWESGGQSADEDRESV